MKNKPFRYSEGFKKSIVALYHDSISQLQLSKDYGVAPSTIYKWIKLYSVVDIDNDTILTAKQVKQLQSLSTVENETIFFCTKLF